MIENGKKYPVFEVALDVFNLILGDTTQNIICDKLDHIGNILGG